ncbi:MAG: hypothetical protein IT367_07490 [Candidatus Hydrogenedentes bacterium]|nr:hypothetical protein [Candidatus Hydrogenedentota bacterium]
MYNSSMFSLRHANSRDIANLRQHIAALPGEPLNTALRYRQLERYSLPASDRAGLPAFQMTCDTAVIAERVP